MHLAIAGREPPLPDVDPASQALVHEANSEPEVSVAAMLNVVCRDTIAEFRRLDEETAERVKAIRELDPRGSGENRPNEIASKPANGRRGGTGKISTRDRRRLTSRRGGFDSFAART